MTTPVRIQRKRSKGFRLQDASPNGLPVAYVGRPTILGNPFQMHDFIVIRPSNGEKEFGLYIDRKDAIEFYKKWFLSMWQSEQNEARPLQTFRNAVRNLAGKNLACWCPLNRECHADWLLETVAEISRHGI